MVMPSGIDAVEHHHLGLGLVDRPRHVAGLEVVEHRDVVLLEDRDVVVEVLALEGVGDHGLVLHADLVLESLGAQGADGPLELPRRGVRAGEREVPGDVVLEDGRRALVHRRLDPGEIEEALMIAQDGLGCGADHSDLAFAHGGAKSSGKVACV
jgi:hypothetical protein